MKPSAKETYDQELLNIAKAVLPVLVAKMEIGPLETLSLNQTRVAKLAWSCSEALLRNRPQK